jgi:hypothetical protein
MLRWNIQLRVFQGPIIVPVIFSLFMNERLARIRGWCTNLCQWPVNRSRQSHRKSECRHVQYLTLVTRKRSFFEPTKITSYCNKLAIASNLKLSTNFTKRMRGALGLIINNKLNWNDLVNSAIQKVYCTLRRLCTSADLIPDPVGKKLTVTLFVPLF